MFHDARKSRANSSSTSYQLNCIERVIFVLFIGSRARNDVRIGPAEWYESSLSTLRIEPCDITQKVSKRNDH